MKRFFSGFVFGVMLGATVSAFAAHLVGGNGYLIGWDVTVDGEEVCSDPYVWMSTRQIDCD